MYYGKCKNCIHRRGIRCPLRSMCINPKFIKIYGCDNYKPNYESLLKEDKNDW